MRYLGRILIGGLICLAPIAGEMFRNYTGKSYTHNQAIQVVSEKLPEKRSRQLRGVPIVEDAKIGAYFDYTDCSRPSIHVVKPDPDVIAHEFGHYIFDCDITAAEREEFRNLLKSIQYLRQPVWHDRYYDASEGFSNTLTRQMFSPGSMTEREQPINRRVKAIIERD